MQEYRDRAQVIARALRDIPGIVVKPDPPQTNMMHVFVQGDPDAIMDRVFEIARADRVLLASGLRPTSVPGWSMFELSTHGGSDTLSEHEIRSYMERLPGA
jgi:hypothetical protein